VRRANILAHRGLWTEPAEKNSRHALRRALEQGFGIETDFRDSGGVLWISHDPVSEATTLDAVGFFEDCAASGGDGRLALNIKADGLHAMIAQAVAGARVPLERVYAFDMSVPDALGYVRRSFPVYSRVSEYEPEPSFATDASGVWVDNFTGSFPQVSRARELLEAGFRVSIVSPELHGRPHEELWSDIRAAALHEHPMFELCTDFPEEAHRFLASG
jgi:glycerophosphoryl diester phosphodiesterase